MILCLQIAFGAREGENGLYSAIAVDDVVMFNRTCPTVTSCSFEDDFCGWTNVQLGDDSEWLLHQGPTPTDGTGPKYDHTLNTALGELFPLINVFANSYMSSSTGEHPIAIPR